MELKQRIATVVDYDAWKRGYMPPSEHVLIDQLAYRGARVVMSTDFGDHGAIWIVTRDISKMNRTARNAFRDIINDVLDDVFADKEKTNAEKAASQIEAGSDGGEVAETLSSKANL